MAMHAALPGRRPDDPARTPADPVEEMGKQSFPASDPPGWTGMRAGAPDVGSRSTAHGGALPEPAERLTMIWLITFQAVVAGAALLALAWRRRVRDREQAESTGPA